MSPSLAVISIFLVMLKQSTKFSYLNPSESHILIFIFFLVYYYHNIIIIIFNLSHLHCASVPNTSSSTFRPSLPQPQNLVLMGEFPECAVKLCDFEISRKLTPGRDVREILGTPDYVGECESFCCLRACVRVSLAVWKWFRLR